MLAEMYYLVTFLAGFCIMVLELVAARVLAPYLGTSLTVWTAVIGVVMVCLALGYWLGGRAADAFPEKARVQRILGLSAGWIAVSLVLQVLVLPIFAQTRSPLALQAVGLALLLFGPSSTLLAMISPYCLRMSVASVQDSGRVSGRVSAAGTAGSLVGTFLTGFVLLEVLGSDAIQLVVGILLVVLSVFLAPRKAILLHVLVATLLAGAYWVHLVATRVDAARGIISLQTPYSSIKVMNWTDPKSGRAIKSMVLGGVVHASVFTDTAQAEELVHPYTRSYRLASDLAPLPGRVLMLGGAAYTVPRDILKREPQALVEVAEIDPSMPKIAKEYFGLGDSPRLVNHEIDGRRFLESTPAASFDWILGDAFGSYFSVPFELTTVQAHAAIAKALRPGGLYVANMIGTLEGTGSDWIHDLGCSAARGFGNSVTVALVPMEPTTPAKLQNITVIIRKDGSYFPDLVLNQEDEMRNLWAQRRTLTSPSDCKNAQLLTDDFAPTERYMQEFMHVE